MFSNFTWWHFIIVVLIALLLYYPVILLLYYRKELSGFFSRFHSSNDLEEEPKDNEEVSYLNMEGSPEQENSQAASGNRVAGLMQEIDTAIELSMDTKSSNRQVLELIKVTLQKYPDLKQSPEQVQLNEYIIVACKRANVTLTMVQVYALWISGKNASVD